ncbi:YqeG family HAD IIIA-type phosphatase [Thermohalobacter berrensis]|uniref:HAD family hydrolase n=1 Tax=Thermohalobacter berrensis TaxID=99594 RepID=A0A419TAT6_9FIRM|nr:YqeG family HAD IIIA-type phosphatase [Thermohalobacter berrensis]RKD34596.1 HAD family hydrolase [Thermohalobacter berrensis]
MTKILYPNQIVDSVFDIDLLELKERGFKCIIVDIDNTLIAWDKKHATKKVINWFEKVQMLGFKVCIASNATKSRVVKFNDKVKVLAIYRAAKPRKKPFKKAIKLMKTTPEKTVVIGDQIFTDILGGNRLGAYTVLVSPISDKELIFTKFIRKLEKLVLKKAKLR